MLKKGQSLTLLLVVVSMCMTIVGSAVAVIATNSRAGSAGAVSKEALHLAESGMEDALIQLLRNPGFTGETLTTSNGTATITVTGTNPKTIVSSAVSFTSRRKIQVSVAFAAGKMTVTSWKEVN